jgi:hypothetical protein
VPLTPRELCYWEHTLLAAESPGNATQVEGQDKIQGSPWSTAGGLDTKLTTSYRKTIGLHVKDANSEWRRTKV